MRTHWRSTLVIVLVVALTAVVGALCEDAAMPDNADNAPKQLSNPYELLATPNAQWLLKFKDVPIEDTMTCFNLKRMEARLQEQQRMISQLRSHAAMLESRIAALECGPLATKSVPVDEQRDGPVEQSAPEDQP
jgi:hypothetical protein